MPEIPEPGDRATVGWIDPRRNRMSDYYALDEQHNAYVVPDFLTWARMFEDIEKRRVARTDVAGGVEVSTVFLGRDHNFFGGPPLLFETMVFGGPDDQWQERYGTWAEAEAGHSAVVALLSAGLRLFDVEPSDG